MNKVKTNIYVLFLLAFFMQRVWPPLDVILLYFDGSCLFWDLTEIVSCNNFILVPKILHKYSDISHQTSPYSHPTKQSVVLAKYNTFFFPPNICYIFQKYNIYVLFLLAFFIQRVWPPLDVILLYFDGSCLFWHLTEIVSCNNFILVPKFLHKYSKISHQTSPYSHPTKQSVVLAKYNTFFFPPNICYIFQKYDICNTMFSDKQ